MPVLRQELDFLCYMSWSPFLCSVGEGGKWLFVFFYISGIVDHHCSIFHFIKYVIVSSDVGSAGFRQREALGYSTCDAPPNSPPSRLEEDGSVFNQFQERRRWWGVFKILQYSEMECNCVRKITEGLFRKYSTLWQHKCESPITVLKILYTLARGPLNLEALGFKAYRVYW
jgi:hypothetical protein